MAKPVVDTVSLSKTDKKVKAKIALKYTKPSGHTVELKTSPRMEPTEDMLAMAEQLADYLSSGRKPPGWKP